MAKPSKAKKASGIQKFIQTHGPITSFQDVLASAEPRPPENATQTEKKLYATRLSNAMAVLVASKLEGLYFEGVLPKKDGTGGESRARTGKGVKKLDVNYSTPELGLGLGVSIKSANYRDGKTKRYTKNYTARDAELRAEAMDYHVRQPFAVLAAVVLVPADACDDGDPTKPKTSWSSFAHAVEIYRHRIGHSTHEDDAQLFERGFIGLYEHQGPDKGKVVFFDIEKRPPQFGRPKQVLLLDLDGMMAEIVKTYDRRNSVKKAWQGDDSDEALPLDELPPPETDAEAAAEAEASDEDEDASA